MIVENQSRRSSFVTQSRFATSARAYRLLCFCCHSMHSISNPNDFVIGCRIHVRTCSYVTCSLSSLRVVLFSVRLPYQSFWSYHPPPRRHLFRGSGAVAPLFRGVAKSCSLYFSRHTLHSISNRRYWRQSVEFKIEFHFPFLVPTE